MGIDLPETWGYLAPKDNIIDYYSKTSIDGLLSKNQALCEYCTLVSIADTIITLLPF